MPKTREEIEALARQLDEANLAFIVHRVNCYDALLDALQAYMFCEQTDAGRNPHPAGTNRSRAFELGRAAIAQATGEVR